MVSTTKELTDLHFEHRLWANELNFFADELKIYEHRLEELVNKYTKQEMLAELEQFQNQFIRQKEVLDELRHNIKVHEQKIGQALQRGEEAPTDPDFHEYMRGEITSFRNIYKELKAKFFNFMRKYM
jgi:hypothetical protein